jgi:nitrate/nitrite-specific signal transduction histidine kinase
LLYHTLEEHVQQRTRDLAEERNKLSVFLQRSRTVWLCSTANNASSWSIH